MDHYRPSGRACQASNVPLFVSFLPEACLRLRCHSACSGPCGDERPTSPLLGQLDAVNGGSLVGGSSGMQRQSAAIGEHERSSKTNR